MSSVERDRGEGRRDDSVKKNDGVTDRVRLVIGLEACLLLKRKYRQSVG